MTHFINASPFVHHLCSTSAPDLTLIRNLCEWKMIYSECYHQIGFDISSFVFILQHSSFLSPLLPTPSSSTTIFFFLCTLFLADGNFCSLEWKAQKKVDILKDEIIWLIYSQGTRKEEKGIENDFFLRTDDGFFESHSLSHSTHITGSWEKWKISFFHFMISKMWKHSVHYQWQLYRFSFIFFRIDCSKMFFDFLFRFTWCCLC